MTNKKNLSVAFIVLAGLCWGTSPIFVHFLAPFGITSLQMTAVRGTVSFICLILYVLIKNRKLFKTEIKDLLLYLVIGASLFGTAFCYYTAMQMTSPPTAVVLMYTAPVYVMLFSTFFLGEKFSKLKLIALVMMLGGCVLVSGIITDSEFNVWGVLMGILTSFVYAAYNILTKVSMQKKREPVTVTLYSFMFMSAIALSVCNPIDLAGKVSSNLMPALPLCIGLGIVTFVIPYFLFTWSMKHLSAGVASALSIVEPMAATVFSVAFLSEVLNVYSAVGILLILVAVYMLGRSE